jgi:general secretion pathway protein D
VPVVTAPAAATPPAVPGTGGGSPDLIEAARRFEAKSLLGEANVAFEERRLNEALDKYARVLNEFSGALDAADLDLARQRRAEVQVQLNTQGGPSGTGVGDVLGGTLSDRELERQRVEATFRNLLQQARAALDSADTNAARDLVAQARTEVNRGRDVLSEATYQARIDEMETLIGRINVREEQLRIEEGLAQTQRVEDEARSAEADRIARLNAQIGDALARVRTLQAEMKYDEALQVVEQILFLDPTNPAGLLLRDVLEDTMIWRQYSESKRIQANNIGRHLAENHEAAIPPMGIMEYPADWPAITLRRGQTLEFSESPANRPVMAALREQTLPVNFADTPLIDAIGFIQANTGVNIDVDWTALEDIGVDREAPVSLRLSGVSVETLLDRVLSKVSDRSLPAEWAVQDGVLVISSSDVIRLTTSLEIYDIRDLLFEVPDFEDAPHIDLSQQNQQGGRGGGGGGGTGIFGGAGGGGGGGQFEPADREERVTAILDAIRNNIDPDGWIDLGGETGAIQELNGNLIITQTPRAHAQIVTLLNKLRETRQLQINVEARFLTVAQDFFEQIGFDLDVYLNADNNAATIATALDPTTLPSDMFGPDGQLLPFYNSNVVDINGDGTLDDADIIPVFNPRSVGEQWSVIRGAQNSFGIANSLGSAASGFASEILAQNPALGITGRFLDDIQVDFIINATQADQRSVTLTAPRLTFTNGQRAWVAVTTQQSYISDLQPVVADSATAFDPVIATADEGVTLEVIGVVSADRRYVTLTMLTEVAELSFASERDFSGGAGGGGIGGGGGANSEGTLQFPILDRSAVRTTVTIPDQGTALLGGQRVVTEVEVESGVPVLSKIPVLSRFFSNRIEATEDRTLLILVKPTILIQEENEEMAFPGLLDQAGL